MVVVAATVTAKANVNVYHHVHHLYLDRRAVGVVMDHDGAGAAPVHLDQGLSPAADHYCFVRLVGNPGEDAWHYHLSSAPHSLVVLRWAQERSKQHQV